jgi:hypothetical protein
VLPRLDVFSATVSLPQVSGRLYALLRPYALLPPSDGLPLVVLPRLDEFAPTVSLTWDVPASGGEVQLGSGYQREYSIP